MSRVSRRDVVHGIALGLLSGAVARGAGGRIAIANADAGGMAETSIAIAQAQRACRELAEIGA